MISERAPQEAGQKENRLNGFCEAVKFNIFFCYSLCTCVSLKIISRMNDNFINLSLRTKADWPFIYISSNAFVFHH